VHQPVGRLTQLRLYPIRPLWTLGPGWAAIGGVLSSDHFAFSPEAFLKLLLVWLLTDLALGTVWDLGVGESPGQRTSGLWRQLRYPRLPEVAPPLPLLPYTQPNSPGRRLADRLGRWRLWWQTRFWPESGREFTTLIAALGLALLLGIALGRDVLGWVLLVVALSWLVALLPSRRGQPSLAPNGAATIHGLAQFGIPWLIGAAAFQGLSWTVAVLGLCFSIAYVGLIRQATRPAHPFRLIGAGQATAALWLAALRHPLAAGAVAILLIPQWGLWVWAGGLSAFDRYSRSIQPFVLLSLLVAALGIAP